MRLYSTWNMAVLVAVSLLVSCTEDLRQEVRKTPVPSAEFVPGELLIQMKKGGTSGSRMASDVLQLIEGEQMEVLNTEAMNTAASRTGGEVKALVLATSKLGTMEAIAKLQGHPDVEFAEPNWVYHHFAVSNDPYVTNGSLWGMTGTYGSQASVAWTNNKTGSATVYVGIIDEGYMYTHEDIAANAGTNPGETAGNGKDDDGNGYVDDVYGWDFANKDNTVFDGSTDDHGTHVAGTIGGVGGNGKGVAGVNWNVKLISAKFLGRNGGTTANAVLAVDYLTNLKNKGMNLVASNNSWGGGGFSQALQDAIGRMEAAGVLFIAAAGNSGTNNDVTASYPSNYTNANVIAVAAIDSKGALASFSQYGATTVDIGAPGVGINSTLPSKSGASTYGSYSGTSMATPHVTGAAALYKSLNPSATAAQIRSAILGSVTPTAGLAGKCVTGGRLNVGGF